MYALVVCLLILPGVFSESGCNVPELCTNNVDVQAEIVNTHNALRRAVKPTAEDMAMMSWSNDVAQSAQDWADSCIEEHGPPSTRLLNGYELGENLFFSNAEHDWATVITAWHNEVANYLFPNGSTNGGETGHYTQVVWYSSYKIGCGMKHCNPNYFYACHYYRAGNFVGVAPYQPGPPCASCPNNCENKLCTDPCQYVDQYINCPDLKKTYGCGNKSVAAWCQATCLCSNEIRAPYRR